MPSGFRSWDVVPPIGFQKQIDHINSQFEFHCKEVHPRAFPVTGLKATKP